MIAVRDVENTDEFGGWWTSLEDFASRRVAAAINLLATHGPALQFPHSSGIQGSRHTHMGELRVQIGGKSLRIFYVFDPRRTAILLIGGDKTGKDRFYEEFVKLADELYQATERLTRHHNVMARLDRAITPFVMLSLMARSSRP
jgi:hypothetical protein